MPTESLTNRDWELLSGSECQLAFRYEISLHIVYIALCACYLALFWGRSHLLQSLITCSMQIQRVKAWEIWSCVVTEGRHLGPVEAFSCNFHPKGDARVFPRQHQYHSLFTAPGMGRCEMGIITPPVYLPSAYLMSLHVTRSPRPSPFHSCVLQAINPWRWEWLGNELLALLRNIASLTVVGKLWPSVSRCHSIPEFYNLRMEWTEDG